MYICEFVCIYHVGSIHSISNLHIKLILLSSPFRLPPSHLSPPSQKSSSKSSFLNRTSSPALKGGNPTYGHPSQRNASPSAQDPQLPTLPLTVRSISSWSSVRVAVAVPEWLFFELLMGMVWAVADEEEDACGAMPLVVAEEPGGLDDAWRARSASSAVLRFWASSAARRAARPQVQSLQARRLRPGRGRHSVAVRRRGEEVSIVWIWWRIGGKEWGSES